MWTIRASIVSIFLLPTLVSCKAPRIAPAAISGETSAMRATAETTSPKFVRSDSSTATRPAAVPLSQRTSEQVSGDTVRRLIMEHPDQTDEILRHYQFRTDPKDTYTPLPAPGKPGMLLDRDGNAFAPAYTLPPQKDEGMVRRQKRSRPRLRLQPRARQRKQME